MTPVAQVIASKLKPLPIKIPALGCDSVPLETKIARTDPCAAWPACGVRLRFPEAAATGGVVEAAEGTTVWCGVRGIRLVESVSAAAAVDAAAARGPAVAAGAFADEEPAGPRAAAPAVAVRRAESAGRCAFELCDVAVPLEESALPEASAPAIPRPWGPANADPVTNVAAPKRVVSRVARRLLPDLRDLDIGSPWRCGDHSRGESNSEDRCCPRNNAGRHWTTCAETELTQTNVEKSAASVQSRR